MIDHMPTSIKVELKRSWSVAKGISDGLKQLMGRKVVPAFWAEALNFGDLLTPALLRSYGVLPKFTQCQGNCIPCARTLVSCGSILGWIGEDFSGYVLGSGLGMESEGKAMPNAKFLCVRGALTRAAMGLDNSVLLGDPGLLSDRLFNAKTVEKKYKIGIVPHQIEHDGASVSSFLSKLQIGAVKLKLISTRRFPLEVIKDIASCEYIISSSLHGLVISDAFGIPSARVCFGQKIGDFKFWDYFSAYDEPSVTYDARDVRSVNDVVSICKLPEERLSRIAQLKIGLASSYEKYLKEVL